MNARKLLESAKEYFDVLKAFKSNKEIVGYIQAVKAEQKPQWCERLDTLERKYGGFKGLVRILTAPYVCLAKLAIEKDAESRCHVDDCC